MGTIERVEMRLDVGHDDRDAADVRLTERVKDGEGEVEPDPDGEKDVLLDRDGRALALTEGEVLVVIDGAGAVEPDGPTEPDERCDAAGGADSEMVGDEEPDRLAVVVTELVGHELRLGRGLPVCDGEPVCETDADALALAALDSVEAHEGVWAPVVLAVGSGALDGVGMADGDRLGATVTVGERVALVELLRLGDGEREPEPDALRLRVPLDVAEWLGETDALPVSDTDGASDALTAVPVAHVVADALSDGTDAVALPVAGFVRVGEAVDVADCVDERETVGDADREVDTVELGQTETDGVDDGQSVGAVDTDGLAEATADTLAEAVVEAEEEVEPLTFADRESGGLRDELAEKDGLLDATEADCVSETEADGETEPHDVDDADGRRENVVLMLAVGLCEDDPEKDDVFVPASDAVPVCETVDVVERVREGDALMLRVAPAEPVDTFDSVAVAEDESVTDGEGDVDEDREGEGVVDGERVGTSEAVAFVEEELDPVEETDRVGEREPMPLADVVVDCVGETDALREEEGLPESVRTGESVAFMDREPEEVIVVDALGLTEALREAEAQPEMVRLAEGQAVEVGLAERDRVTFEEAVAADERVLVGEGIEVLPMM